MITHTITTAAMEELLQDFCPELTDWRPTDTTYQLVKWSEIPSLIRQSPALPWKENKWECEEIAKSFVVEVRKIEYRDDSIIYNRAISECDCSKLHGEETGHTLNILITDKGIVLLDMQTQEYWLAVKGQDEFYFVEM